MGIIEFLPSELQAVLKPVIGSDKVYEIRLTRDKPLIVCTDGIFFVTKAANLTKNAEKAFYPTKAQIDAALQIMCDNSVYAHQHQIRHGYITLPTGNRVGICGRTIVENGKIIGISDIQTLNIRIAHEVIGAADEIIDKLFENGCLQNTIIISPPACGKTTLLRDIIRQLGVLGIRVSLIDERSEVAAFDTGYLCDTLDSCPKELGMIMALRSLSPDCIATDEIEHEAGLKEIMHAGVSLLCTAHARSIEDLKARIPNVLPFFKRAVILSKRLKRGTIEEVVTL